MRKTFWGGTLCGLLFLLLGCLFVNRTGLQEDESTFAAPFFREWTFYSIRFGHVHIPLMQMSYVGSLKTWLYAPFLWLWPPTPTLLRLPAVIFGAATILLFGALLERLHGRRAAWIGCILLATDSVFLLTTTFDWGPVALQHLLMTAAMLFAVVWFQKGVSASSDSRDRWLIAAAFCCGLAFWDKAVFVWMFSGLLAGSLLFFRSIRDRLTSGTLRIAVAALCLGALPLLIYNFASKTRFATIRSNSQFEAGRFRDKLLILRIAWNGAGLFGYMPYDSTEYPAAPSGMAERVSFAIHSLTGDRRRNASEAALFLALLSFPLLWRTRVRKTLLFPLIACGFAWMFMAFSGGAGSAHHAVLLWPLPYILLAVAFAELSLHIRFGGWAPAGMLAFLAAANLAVTNQYLYQLVRYGPAGSWSDAIYPLAEGIRDAHASRVMLIDWGMEAPLTVLNKNNPPLLVIPDHFLSSSATPAQKKAKLQLLSDDRAIWVEHTSGNEVAAGVNDRVMTAAADAGFVPAMMATYCDRHGRPIFQTFHFIAGH